MPGHVERQQHVAGAHLWIRDGFRHRTHASARDGALLQPLYELVDAEPGEYRFELAFELEPMRDAVGIRAKPRLLEEVLATNRSAERLPEAVVAGADHDQTVTGLERLVRRDRGVRVSE